jgi:F-type H+-transporting ATPase subunit c
MKKNLALVGVALLPAFAMAQEHAEAAAGGANSTAAYWAAGLCMGLAAAGVGYSQSRAASAALEGVGRNPASAKAIFTPLILSLALMEAIGLLAFIIAITLAGK